MPEDARASSELQNPAYEIFIAALSVLSLVNIALYWLIPDDALSNVVLMMDWILSLVFLGDFLNRLRTAESRTGYFLRGFGWADLLASIPVASFKILRLFRLVRVVRLLRQTGAGLVVRSLVRDRAGSALFTLLLIAFLVLEFGSLAILHAELGAPGANIETAQDSVWYLLVTMSTVGYGDQYPVTSVGRVLGSVVIVIGVGIFGTLTGFLANAFVRAEGEPDEQPATATGPDHRADPDAPAERVGREPAAGTSLDVVRELEELRDQHRAALERIDRILTREH